MPEADRDTRLAEIFAKLTERARRGESADVEVFAREHPDLAVELRELWHVAAMADFLGDTLDQPGTGSSTRGSPGMGSPGTRAVREPSGRVFGDYELLEQVGEGGMGVVYRARQLSLGRIVALKMILKGALATPSELARFRAEAAASAHLDHPQVIPIYEVGEVDGQPFFTMKFVQGTTLAARLAVGPLPAREAATLMLGIARAIAYTHANGIVHRDLKPSNILIDIDGRPHVGDFGLAKRVEMTTAGSGSNAVTTNLPSSGESRRREHPTRGMLERWFPEGANVGENLEQLTRSGVILGTPSYMSPEQASGRRTQVGPASDIYSLGAVLYQCLTGRPPFQAASAVDLLLMVLEHDPVPPRVLNSSADSDLEMIAMKCLQKPPELRYRSATELADDLDAWLSNEPISARSTNITQLVSRL
ncbi:MAG: serine/threonine-protein kinase, partial [Planctomycetota bacterium]|nr:serine/threonine-protein kinase [Planctomycetota bacterium]